MSREEFLEMSVKSISQDDYKILEFVYTYHPCICETDGKRQIVKMYNEFGMLLIRDMYKTSLKAKDYEERIRKMKIDYDLMIEEYRQFKQGLL